MTNHHASALGKLARGKAKTLTATERQRRKKHLAQVRKKRWPEKTKQKAE